MCLIPRLCIKCNINQRSLWAGVFFFLLCDCDVIWYEFVKVFNSTCSQQQIKKKTKNNNLEMLHELYRNTSVSCHLLHYTVPLRHSDGTSGDTTVCILMYNNNITMSLSLYSTEGDMVDTEIESAIGGFMSFLSKAGCHYSNHVSANLKHCSLHWTSIKEEQFIKSAEDLSEGPSAAPVYDENDLFFHT